MDHHSAISIDKLISAAKFIEQASIEQATAILPYGYIDGDNEAQRDPFVGKQRVLAHRACQNASTSALGCPQSRSPSSDDCRGPYPGANTRHSRAAHNELEKTRRANLRGYLDKLKDIVPAGSDSARNTTLSLLTRARDYITDLEERSRRAEEEKIRLKERQTQLRVLIEKAQRKGQTVQMVRPESASTISAIDENEPCPASPIYLEYSPSAKPNGSPSCVRTPPVDPYLDGLLPALPLFYPRISLYPYLDVKSHPTFNDTFLPIENALL